MAEDTGERQIVDRGNPALNLISVKASALPDGRGAALLPLAPLQAVPKEQQRHIAEFLTFTEAASMMLACRGLHDSVRADRWLRLDELSNAFEVLGCNHLLRSIQSTEAALAELAIPVVAPVAAVRGITFAGHRFKLPQSRAAKALEDKDRLRQADERAQTAQKEQFAIRLDALAPSIEHVIATKDRPNTSQQFAGPQRLLDADQASLSWLRSDRISP